MKVNPSAFETGQLAEKLANGYFSYQAAITIATDPRSKLLAPSINVGESVPIGYVKTMNGEELSFHFKHFLDLAKSDQLISTELSYVWFSGALLKLGDCLGKHKYFDRAPELELIRHLRNGIAHGNRFRIDKPNDLINFPANNHHAWVKGMTLFEIKPILNGKTVLFDFMLAGDLVHLFLSVGLYLIRMGNGDTLRQ
jgi:hypothetical protein